MSSVLLIEREGPVATLTLNRRIGASELRYALGDAFRELDRTFLAHGTAVPRAWRSW